jgi:acetyltransferase-like isoleucine patch superfamily enzyme
MLKRYGIIGCYKLIISLIYTKLLFPNARLIRFPFDIRNKKHIKIGKNFTTGFNCRIESYPQIKTEYTIIIGENVEINDNVHIASGEKVIIGNNVLIASKVYISDINHGNYKNLNQDSPEIKPNERTLSTNPVIIEDNVWIGEGVCIMPGVKIGKGAIIGALSVVTKDIPSNTISVGNPAKTIKEYDFSINEWITIK